MNTELFTSTMMLLFTIATAALVIWLLVMLYTGARNMLVRPVTPDLLDQWLTDFKREYKMNFDHMENVLRDVYREVNDMRGKIK